ncbi:MAG: hypothetical protein AAF383_26185 [Cyanobacteria bacterium P01_A01_bin.83]
MLWALSDNQGSVKMLLDNDGSVVNNITYDAFGGITVETNPDVNFRFGYTGREHDDETGLNYYRSRLLDSILLLVSSYKRIKLNSGEKMSIYEENGLSTQVRKQQIALWLTRNQYL